MAASSSWRASWGLSLESSLKGPPPPAYLFFLTRPSSDMRSRASQAGEHRTGPCWVLSQRSTVPRACPTLSLEEAGMGKHGRIHEPFGGSHDGLAYRQSHWPLRSMSRTFLGPRRRAHRTWRRERREPRLLALEQVILHEASTSIRHTRLIQTMEIEGKRAL